MFNSCITSSVVKEYFIRKPAGFVNGLTTCHVQESDKYTGEKWVLVGIKYLYQTLDNMGTFFYNLELSNQILLIYRKLKVYKPDLVK